LFYPFVRAMVHKLVERITIGTASIKIALCLEGFGKAVLSLLPRDHLRLLALATKTPFSTNPRRLITDKKSRKSENPDLLTSADLKDLRSTPCRRGKP
jgi:hypothetical protein